MKPLALVPWFPGTNCHLETAYAFELSGARAEVVLLNHLIRGKRRLAEADLIALSGGFSYGDHFRAGWIASLDLVLRLQDQLLEAQQRQVPMIGICNGFQILAAAGLLPGNGSVGHPTAVLDQNESASFVHYQWVSVWLHEPPNLSCLWTRNLDHVELRLPVAHGEGRPVILNGNIANQVVATYGSYEGDHTYPASPCGSHVAGICDPTGRIFGLMPHPERRSTHCQGSDGRKIFEAGVRAVR